jgi:hypothetical protein
MAAGRDYSKDQEPHQRHRGGIGLLNPIRELECQLATTHPICLPINPSRRLPGLALAKEANLPSRRSP